jgi:hypothetical protein
MMPVAEMSLLSAAGFTLGESARIVAFDLRLEWEARRRAQQAMQGRKDERAVLLDGLTASAEAALEEVRATARKSETL